MVPARWPVRSLRRGKSVNTRSMSASISALGAVRRVKAPIIRFSSTVMRPNRRRASGTSVMPRLTIAWVARPSMRWPAKWTLPWRGRTTPRMVFIVVDLPDALPPSRQTISPSRTSMLTPFSAWIGP